MQMIGTLSSKTSRAADLRFDIALIGFLIAFDVAARLLPHMPNLTPVAASALFAGTVLRHRGLAPLVPLIALTISDAVIGFDSWRLTAVIYVASIIPALLPMLSERLRRPGMFVPAIIASSLLFFAVTNLAVWAFSGMYPLTGQGLVACYVAALPFLKNSVMGDLLWACAFFGGAWLVQRTIGRGRSSADAAQSLR
jgi:hypothetical protein